MKNIFEKSIYLNCNLKKGKKKLAQKCLIIKNQETDSAKYYLEVIGTSVNKNLKKS